ncbi:hypothetical protein PALB_35820 [Pseudoalteromonas luteoviolacea B = ATCC 29581]|nr:hypothetical protein PALB_35820 [Pseudoalteromonas luteoviolacea B = ATCC 29581]
MLSRVLILFFILLCVTIVFFHSEQEDNKKTNNTSREIPNDKTRLNPPLTAAKITPSTSNTPVGEQNACLPQSQFNTHPAVLAREHLETLNNLNPMAFDSGLVLLDESSLLAIINQGSLPQASYILAMNLFWQAHYEGFTNPFLSEELLTHTVFTRKPLDLNSLKQARYWFWQAALHDIPLGFIGLADTYQLEANLNTALSLQERNQMINHASVYLNLAIKVSPNFANYAELQMVSLSKEQALRFTYYLRQWHNARTKLNKPILQELVFFDELMTAKKETEALCIKDEE